VDLEDFLRRGGFPEGTPVMLNVRLALSMNEAYSGRLTFDDAGRR
jgi:hypothetical protein